MPSYYVPSENGAQPRRAVKILLRFLIYGSLVGLLWKYVINRD